LETDDDESSFLAPASNLLETPLFETPDDESRFLAPNAPERETRWLI